MTPYTYNLPYKGGNFGTKSTRSGGNWWKFGDELVRLAPFRN
jgi:hypothetical protein